MEIEPSPPMKATKQWSIVRIVFFMLRKGLTKTKLMLDLHLMLKQGKIVSKALTNLMLHHPYSTFSCRPNDVNSSFISPRAYEFSCSNSPLIPRRKYHYHRHCNQNHQHEINVAQKVVDMFDEYESVEGSPMINLPGFGRSPKAVRQLRVTDSPFSVKDVEENTSQVDMAAEEFIKKFYKELMEQQKIAYSPSPRHKWGR